MPPQGLRLRPKGASTYGAAKLTFTRAGSTSCESSSRAGPGRDTAIPRCLLKIWALANPAQCMVPSGQRTGVMGEEQMPLSFFQSSFIHSFIYSFIFIQGWPRPSHLVVQVARIFVRASSEGCSSTKRSGMHASIARCRKSGFDFPFFKCGEIGWKACQNLLACFGQGHG